MCPHQWCSDPALARRVCGIGARVFFQDALGNRGWHTGSKVALKFKVSCSRHSFWCVGCKVTEAKCNRRTAKRPQEAQSHHGLGVWGCSRRPFSFPFPVAAPGQGDPDSDVRRPRRGTDIASSLEPGRAASGTGWQPAGPGWLGRLPLSGVSLASLRQFPHLQRSNGHRARRRPLRFFFTRVQPGVPDVVDLPDFFAAFRPVGMRPDPARLPPHVPVPRRLRAVCAAALGPACCSPWVRGPGLCLAHCSAMCSPPHR